MTKTRSRSSAARLAVARLGVAASTLVLVACQSDPSTPGNATEPGPAGAPEKVASQHPEAGAEPRQEPIVGPPVPALLIAQAQFADMKMPDGKTVPVPGPAKLTIARLQDGKWTTTILEDRDSNVFHKAMSEGDGRFLTIGGTKAMLKSWHNANGTWEQTTHWNPKFGGKIDRLRDFERGDVDGDGKAELVVATHDQGVIAILHPDESWRVEQIDQTKDTFVHEIELGDVDGDGQLEIFATPSKPNKLDQEQPGEVTMYKRDGSTWKKSIVDAPGDTHAKEILATDIDRDGTAELYIVWEGAIGEGGKVVRPVTIKQYRSKAGKWESTVVAEVPDRQMRAMASGDVNGDGKVDLVAAGLSSGLWLIEQDGEGWKKTNIEAKSSGFEHPVLIADVDENGTPEIYVAAEDQNEVARYVWRDGRFEKTVVTKLVPGDITWNVTAGRL